MRIALVLSMEIPADLQPEHGKYAKMFENLFRAVDPNVSLTVFDGFTDERVLPTDKEVVSFDAVLIPGSPTSAVADIAWVHEMEEFIRRVRDLGVPLVGVCFGHQLIAKALGGEVQAQVGAGYNIGVDTYYLSGDHEWMQPPTPWVTCSVTHYDQVVQPPPGAVLFARSEICPIAGFVMDKTALCVQSHPEMSPAFIAALIERRQSSLSEEGLQLARKSLKLPHQGDALAAWVVNWVRLTRSPLWFGLRPRVAVGVAVGVAVALGAVGYAVTRRDAEQS